MSWRVLHSGLCWVNGVWNCPMTEGRLVAIVNFVTLELTPQKKKIDGF